MTSGFETQNVYPLVNMEIPNDGEPSVHAESSHITSQSISPIFEDVVKPRMDVLSLLEGACDLSSNIGSLSTNIETIPDEIERASKDSSKEHIDVNSLRKSSVKKRNLDDIFDPNEDVYEKENPNPFYPYKLLDHAKPKAASECGSSTGLLEESDSLKMWKIMKENGFLSSSYGGVPIPILRTQPKKRKKDVMKEKIELAKKEEVDKFTKIAAPSGLLSGLNPGIINHVRNSKQVHSIIKALVDSERLDEKNRVTKRCTTNDSKNLENINDFDKSYKDNTKTVGYPVHNQKNHTLTIEHEKRGAGSEVIERTPNHKSSSKHISSESGDDERPLEVSSSNSAASENINSKSDKFFASQEGITSLSVKAATVALQWLDLLHQDIKGRLAALRRSRKRVQTVIQVSLNSIFSTELLPNQLNANSNDMEAPITHMTKWKSIFERMYVALCEEEKHLEMGLKQVKEMQSNCQQGLQPMNVTGGSDNHLEFSEGSSRLKAESLERECAIRAAAASIYSTCNLALTSENVPCF